jgi:hypothetical protein
MTKAEFEARKAEFEAEREASQKEHEQIVKIIRAKALEGDGLALVAFAILEASGAIIQFD